MTNKTYEKVEGILYKYTRLDIEIQNLEMNNEELMEI